jgi:hypothetical protein
MKRTNQLLFLVAALPAMAAGAAMAQPPERSGPPGIEMLYGGRLERDLKLSDDVAGKLADLRDEIEAALQKECRNAGINPRDVSKLTPEQRDTYLAIRRRLSGEFDPRAAALLSPDQLKRLAQIAFQNRLKVRAPDALLADDVAAELKLTDDQKQTLNSLKSENAAKQLERGFNRTEYMGKALAVLTNEQKQTLNKLKGNEVPDRPTDEERLAQMQRAVPTFFYIQSSPSVGMVHFAALVAVQNDLAVSEDVARKLTLLRDDYRATYKKACQQADVLQTGGSFSAGSEYDRKLQDIGRKLDEEFIPKLNGLLSDDQQKRFKQILFQNHLRNRGPTALLDVRTELNLAYDQQEKLRALWRDNGVERTLKATKAVEFLSAEQKAILDTLKGKEFDTSQLVIRGRARDT